MCGELSWVECTFQSKLMELLFTQGRWVAESLRFTEQSSVNRGILEDGSRLIDGVLSTEGCCSAFRVRDCFNCGSCF